MDVAIETSQCIDLVIIDARREYTTDAVYTLSKQGAMTCQHTVRTPGSSSDVCKSRLPAEQEPRTCMLRWSIATCAFCASGPTVTVIHVYIVTNSFEAVHECGPVHLYLPGQFRPIQFAYQTDRFGVDNCTLDS